ncbi:T9SS type A sorting domain-containing protein [Barnesiella sp. ET7]|uniref:LamG-like jellyroll fold domain-containing protein n=1 Tax=Barnesiella sp. ET7 TaxID=2972460 RepID=UPI0021AC3E4E|nr:LamG-like jellyroll fold domain-containing protein [Barnesiella sp. ET7]MCR8912652.1 T9SS type A sorting domain-containing protein [Barnesiella sp. ET7]
MRKHFLLFSLLFVLLPFFTTQAQENKAINIPQLNINWSTSAYRLEVPETILGDRNGGETDRTGKSFTLSAWINMDQFTNGSYNNKGNVIMGHGARFHFNYNGSLVLATTTDGTLKIISGGGNTVSGNINATIDLNTWTYLTLVYDNSDFSVKVYKDGTLVDSRNNGSQLTLFGDDPCIFFVGGAGFSGLCDEMQFYNKALTADEVAQAYNNNPQGVSGLTAWYDFNEIESGTTGTFANKATGSAHADTKAVFYNLTNATLSSDGGYTSIKAFTETAPTLAEGRTIETTTMYTVTVPETVENGTLSVMSGETALNAGENQVEAGTELTITATPSENYFVESLTVNGTPVENGGTYVVNENATIAVSFAEIEMHSVSVAIDESVDYQITMDGEPVEDLTSIVAGSKLTLTINTLPQGKKLASVTLGDEPLEANEDGTYTFTVTADATLTVTLADIAYYTVTLPETVENGTLTVMKGDVALNPGENTQIEEGTTLTITATPNSGYEILSLLINGEEKIDEVADNTYTIASLDGDVTVEAAFSEKVLYWQITCMVEGNGTVTIYDEEGTQYPSGYSQIPSNVDMRLEFEPAEGYEIVDFYETDAEGETTSLLTQIQSNVYNIGRLTGNHIYNVKFSAISGIEETIDALSIYCNAGMLYVNGLGENATIEIYDITGKLVKVAHEAPVNVSDLYNGCYIVKVAMNNAEKMVKFIKR